MPNHDLIAIVQRLVGEYAVGNLDVLDELLLDEFYSYRPRPGEQTAPEAYRRVGADILGAVPDLSVTLAELVLEDDQVAGKVRLSGTFVGPLWLMAGTGATHTLEARFAARSEDGRVALTFSELNLVALLREMKIISQPQDAHLKPNPHPRIPEIVYRLLFNGMHMEEKPCSHLDRIQVTEPTTDVCEQCVASGDEWPALRMCLECGFVGCCDLSVNKHVKLHCEATGHTLIRSIMPGDSWLWCYQDRAFLSSWHLTHR